MDLLNYEGKVYSLTSDKMWTHSNGVTTMSYTSGQYNVNEPMTDVGGVWFAALQAAATTL